MKKISTALLDNVHRFSFFWGLKNTYGYPSHQDVHGSNVAMFLLKGKKEFFFLNPKFKEHACPFKIMGNSGFGVDFHLKYGYCTSDNVKTHGFRVELEVGDILIWPKNWIHQVKNLEETIAFNVIFN